MRVLVGGDDVYLFDDGDPIADMQAEVMVGANLDVTSYRGVTEEGWAKAVQQLEDLKVIDCRKEAQA